MKHKYNMLGSLMGEEEDGNDQVYAASNLIFVCALLELIETASR